VGDPAALPLVDLIAHDERVRALVVTAVSASLVLLASAAHAQAITIAPGFPQRAGSRPKPSSGIDCNDCVRPFETWTFGFTLPAGVSFDDLEVWARAGTSATASCAPASARSGSTKSCFHVATWPASAVSGSQPVQTSSAAMMQAIVGKTDVVDATSIDRDTVCYPTADEQATSFTLDFLLFAAGDVVGGATSNPYEGSYATKYDRGMPAPPTGFSATVDATQTIQTAWDANATPADVTGFHVYCFDLTDVDAGCQWPAEVQKNGFVAYQIDAAPCAVAPANATSVPVIGLGRDRTYALVITSVDDADNTGPFSSVACVTTNGNLVPGGGVDPPPADDSSSGCTCRAAGARAGTAAAILASLAGAVALFFRRRRV
jgi:hypothetical protein